MTRQAKIVVKIERETDKAVLVSADVYRDSDATNASAWLPRSQITMSEVPGRGTPEFAASVHTTIVELPRWLFDKIETETRCQWHDVSDTAKAARLAEIRGY